MSWADVVARLRRRRLSEAMGIKTGLFMSAWKNLEPVLTEMGLEPGAPGSEAVFEKLKERIKGPRIGIVSRFARDLLAEVNATPVTDEEVQVGEKKAHEEHEAAVKRRRLEKKARQEQKTPRASDAGSGAGAGAVAAGPSGAAGPVEEEEGEEDEGEDASSAPTPPRHVVGRGEDEAGQENSPVGFQQEGQMSTEPANNEEEYEDEGEEQQDGQDQDDVPPSRRPAPRARVAPQPQYIVLPQVRTGKVQGQQRRAGPPQAKFIKPQTMVRISKRAQGGKTIYINDYTSDEIGGSLKNFLKEQVDPEYAEPSGQTEYLVQELFNDGREGTPVRFTIAGTPQNGLGSGVDQIRDALDLVNDLRADAREEASRNAEVMGAAKKTAAGSGDFGQLMMLMMMERLMGPKSSDPEQIVKMVLEKIHPAQAAAPIPQMPFIPPPQFLGPPVPAPADEFTKLLLHRTLNPPPNPMDEVMKAVLVKAIVGGPLGGAPVDHGLTEEKLKVLLAQYTAPKAPEAGAIDSALGTFEKLSTMVTTLAPKLNAGGITGALQGILTPDLQKALGNMMAGAIPQMGPQPGAPPPGGPPRQLPPGPQPQQPQVQLPPEVLAAMGSLKIAQTRDFQLEAAANLFQTMYMNPMFQPSFEPALAQLLKGFPRDVQNIMGTVLTDVRPELATHVFIDDVLRFIGKRAGIDVDATVRAAAGEKKETVKEKESPAPSNVIQLQREASPWDAQIEQVKAKEREEAAVAAKKKAEEAAAAQAAIANAASAENAPPVQQLGVVKDEQALLTAPTTPPVEVVKFDEKVPARPSA